MMRCSGPFDDLFELQELWRAAFPGDSVYCHNWECTGYGAEHTGPHELATASDSKPR